MKGWLDNFGKADNANDSNVSLSEDFVGLGYNTKGRNYSPAWGGQFQKGGNLLMQQTMQGVQPTPTVPYLTTKDPAEFYKAWIQSPEYAKRQLLTGYSSGEDLIIRGGYMPSAAASRESILGSLEEMTPITYSTRQPSEAKPGGYGSPSYVNINPSDYVGTSKEAILAHELAHIAGANRHLMSDKEQEIFKKSMLPMAEPVLSGVQGSKEREASIRALEDYIHLQKPDEAKADLGALRFMMYDKGIYDITKGKKFTDEDFEKAKQSFGKDRVFKRLTDRVGKKNFVNLMNTIALADEEGAPIAMGGMSIPGSVGFTYARTAGAAPSNGPYAKKTKASAQIGKNVKKNDPYLLYKKDATNIDTGIADKIAGLELKMSPEYQRLKYLQSLPQLREAPGLLEELIIEGLAIADIATDLMQVGNFIPNPMAQGVGKAGNIVGSGVDLVQAAMSSRQGNYLDAAINLGSVGLAGGLASSTFRRNSKYLQPGQPLYPLSPQAFGSLSRTNYIEPFRKVGKMTDKNLLANKALLGLIGAETVYDAIPQKEYGGDIPSAQNGEEDIKTIDLPEIVVTPYDEQYPFYQSLSNEQKRYINDKGPIGRAIRAIATTGKKGQTAKDISSAVRNFQQTGAEFTGIPGTIRFSDNPLEKLTGTGKTILDLAMVAPGFGNPLSAITGPLVYGLNDGINPITGEQMFSQENLEGTFDTLDALGMATGAMTVLKQPVQQALRTSGKLLTTKTPLKNTYKINPFAVKEPDVILTRTQKPGQTAELRRLDELESKGLDNLDFMERYEYNQILNSPVAKAPGYARGFSSDLGDIGYYSDPAIQTTRGYEGFPEILKMRLPATEAAKFNVAQNPLQGYISYAPKREFLLPKDLVYSAESFTPTVGYGVGPAGFRGPGSLSHFIRTADAEQRLANIPHWLRGYPSIANKSSVGLSMIDPSLISGGVGLLRKPVQLGAKATQSSFGELFRGINPANLKTQSGLDWSKRWYEHPETLQRKIKIASSANFRDFDDGSIKRFSNDFIENAKESLNQYQPKSYIDLLKDKGLKEYLEYFLNTGGLSYGIPDQIYVNRAMYFPFNKKGLESVRTHELSHLVNRNGRALTFPEEDMLLKPFGFEDNVQRVNTIKEVKSKSKKKWISYYTKPTEIKARMDQARFDLNLSPEDQFTPEMFDEISKKNNFYGMRKYIKDKKSFVDLMNNFWAVPAVGVAVGAQAVDQQKNGGIIKDNQGYWNQDNWGQPVEIGSNNITMEGVYEPLLGISDTGDTRLMQPGKNYKFKGKKVTEFPVAELGINDLDAYPMKKLNQLLNFTNNPDKDNWLDKYN